ncbi:MAG: protein translocase subunit SecF [bacterium]|nr:protein translocase subunit SecF [bacterium]
MNVIGNKYVFLGCSGLLIAASIVVIGTLGLKQGIDFTGGTMWQVTLGDERVNADGAKAFLSDELKLDDAIVTPEPATQSFLIRTKEIDEAKHVEYKAAFVKAYPNFEELRFDSIGPAIGSELRSRAIWAFLFVLLGISLYIAFAFRKVSYPVSSWKYGLITLLTLFHDAIIPTGLFAVLGYLYHAEVDTNFIVAILVVMGFSVHDTIVVFDRIRENLRLERSAKFDFDALVNTSVNETMARSINTSLTLVLVLVALYFLGSSSLAYFTLTILVGTVFGTYSSIFVASPLLTMWRKR